jgi:hypothetical protein
VWLKRGRFGGQKAKKKKKIDECLILGGKGPHSSVTSLCGNFLQIEGFGK